ncbi:MAG: hypothetical protein K2K79_08135 [Paramuribaculum sp.]|nr:hypothetical protein [Paramuribaculum sp.]
MNTTSSTAMEKWWGYFFAIAILGIIIVTYTISDSQDLPLTIIGAVLGVAMTVFATYFLFKGQSNQQAAMIKQQSELQMALMREQHNIERIREKESEIFKQKLASYNRFLNALRNYVTESTPTNKKEIIFHTMALRMHCSENIITELDNNVIKIIDAKGTQEEVEKLIEALNEISYIFGRELYEDSDEKSRDLSAFVTAISGSQEEPTENEKLIEAEEEEKEDAAAMKGASVIGWDDKINDLKKSGWLLTPGNDSFTLSSDSKPVIISVYRKKGKYVVEATKDGDNEFSKILKDNFKGSRRYSTWWRELPINNYGVTEGTLLAQLPTNDRARASVIKWINKLTDFLKSNN